jgi:hypothetical protein
MSCLTPDPCEQVCECCVTFKLCKMYVLQNGHAAWVCAQCRQGPVKKPTYNSREYPL